MVDWSDERIAALSDQDLRNLLANAERKSVTGIIAQCKAEMERRGASRPRKPSKLRTGLKEFEHDVSAQLAAVGKQMAEKYDLSGGTILNVVRYASLMALSRSGNTIWQHDLEEGIRRVLEL